jgi:hypothetical protein
VGGWRSKTRGQGAVGEGSSLARGRLWLG